MKSFISRHQISIFFILTFVFSWFPWYAGIGPEVMTMGPSLVAFLIVIVVGGKHGLIDFLRPFGRWRAKLYLWGIAIFGPAILYLIGLGVYVLFDGESPPFIMIREELHLIPLYLVLDDETVKVSLSTMADLCVEGSVIAQDFYSQAFLSGEISKPAKKQFNLFEKMGEPAKFGLDMSDDPRAAVESFLNDCGLKMIDYIQFGENLDIKPFYCIVEAERI